MNLNRVLIAIPTTGDMVPLPFAKSLMALDRPQGTDIQWIGHTITSAARCLASVRAVERGYSHVFFMDADQTFDPRTLQKLLQHDVPVVSGLYRPRRGSGNYMAFNLTDEGLPYQVNTMRLGRGLQQVDAVPTGCLLIKTEVLRKLPQPHFFYDQSLNVNKEQYIQRALDAGLDVDWTEEVQKYGYGVGEDINFCKLCREHGVPVYVDTDVLCGHLTMTQVGVCSVV